MKLYQTYKQVFNFFHFSLIKGNDKNIHILFPHIQKEGDRFEIVKFNSKKFSNEEMSSAEFQLELFFVTSWIYHQEVLEELFINWAPGVNDIWVNESNGFYGGNIGLGNGDGYHGSRNHKDKMEALLDVINAYITNTNEKNFGRIFRRR